MGRIFDNAACALAIITLLIAALLYFSAPPVQAAQPADSSCGEPVASTGVIEVWYCEPENAPPFYVNSVGFMVVQD
jgi:hypothetical protein